jgi:hypothetical protein
MEFVLCSLLGFAIGFCLRSLIHNFSRKELNEDQEKEYIEGIKNYHKAVSDSFSEIEEIRESRPELVESILKSVYRIFAVVSRISPEIFLIEKGVVDDFQFIKHFLMKLYYAVPGADPNFEKEMVKRNQILLDKMDKYEEDCKANTLTARIRLSLVRILMLPNTLPKVRKG